MRLLGAIELFGLGVFRPAMDESGLQPLGNEPLSHPRDRRAADLQSVGDLHVGPGFAGSILALVGLEQDTRMGQLSRWGVAASDHALQSAAVVLGQDHGVLSPPRHADASCCSLPRGHSEERARARYPRRDIVANQPCQCSRLIWYSSPAG